MDVSDDIASAMGFSSFGTQPNSKRRKINSMLAGDTVAPSMPPPHVEERKKGDEEVGGFQTRRKRNPDEFDLGVDGGSDGDGEEEGKVAGEEDDDGDLVKVGGSGEREDPRGDQGGDEIRDPFPAHNLPARPPPSQYHTFDNGASSNHRGRGRGSHGPRRGNGGDDGKPWYENYYDPQSNQNPWERLEEQLDLSPKGSWLPRGHGYPRS